MRAILERTEAGKQLLGNWSKRKLQSVEVEDGAGKKTKTKIDIFTFPSLPPPLKRKAMLFSSPSHLSTTTSLSRLRSPLSSPDFTDPGNAVVGMVLSETQPAVEEGKG